MILEKNLLHHLFIIDESADSSVSTRELIYQVNQSIHAIRTEALRNDHQEHKITLFATSSQAIRCLYSNTTALNAPLMHMDHIHRVGESNIHDAIGVGIGSMRVAAHRLDAPVTQQMTIFASCRDQASTKYSPCSLNSLIRLLKKQDWLFSLIGYSIEVPELASEIGIDMHCTLKSKVQRDEGHAILGMMARQWIRQNRVKLPPRSQQVSEPEAA